MAWLFLAAFVVQVLARHLKNRSEFKFFKMRVLQMLHKLSWGSRLFVTIMGFPARLRLLAAMASRPAGVRGPVLWPPCILQRLASWPPGFSTTRARPSFHPSGPSAGAGFVAEFSFSVFGRRANTCRLFQPIAAAGFAPGLRRHQKRIVLRDNFAADPPPSRLQKQSARQGFNDGDQLARLLLLLGCGRWGRCGWLKYLRFRSKARLSRSGVLGGLGVA